MALAGVMRVTLAKALRLTQSYVSDVACGSYRTIAVENAWKFAAYFGCRIEDFSVTLLTFGLKAGRTLEVAGHPAVMSLVTPTPACSGEIDRERRPRCSIVDRAARGLHGVGIRAGRRRCRRRPVRVCRQRWCTTMG